MKGVKTVIKIKKKNKMVLLTDTCSIATTGKISLKLFIKMG